jgi:hypothetical protein
MLKKKKKNKTPFLKYFIRKILPAHSSSLSNAVD